MTEEGHRKASGLCKRTDYAEEFIPVLKEIRDAQIFQLLNETKQKRVIYLQGQVAILDYLIELPDGVRAKESQAAKEEHEHKKREDEYNARRTFGHSIYVDKDATV